MDYTHPSSAERIGDSYDGFCHDDPNRVALSTPFGSIWERIAKAALRGAEWGLNPRDSCMCEANLSTVDTAFYNQFNPSGNDGTCNGCQSIWI